jgi:hypothetical protein
MKFISAMMVTLGTGAALMSAAVSPVSGNSDKKNETSANQASQIAKVQPVQAQEFNGAIKVIAPQKDRSTKRSRKCDSPF